jgi:type IV secretory pathway VirB2 component (pilin)
MKAAMRAISAVIGVLFLGIAIKFGIDGSWATAFLFFVLFGGAEFAAYALGTSPLPRRR